MQFVETLVCSEPGRLQLERRPAPRPAGAGSRAPAAGRHLRNGLPHLRGQAPVSRVSAGHGPRARGGDRRRPGRAPLGARRGLRRQPVSVVRAVRRLPQRKAELLRTHLGARGASGRGHGRVPFAAGRQPDTSARPHPRPVRDGRVPRHRRPCGEPGRRIGPGPGPRGRRRADRPRRRALRPALRGTGHHLRPAADRSESARFPIAGVDTVPADAGPLDAGLPDGAGFDVVFDATGNPPAMERGFDYVAHGGRFVLVSVVKETITFMDPDFHRKEMSLFGSRNATAEDFQRVISAHRDGRSRRSPDHAPDRFERGARHPQVGNRESGIDQGPHGNQLGGAGVAVRRGCGP